MRCTLYFLIGPFKVATYFFAYPLYYQISNKWVLSKHNRWQINVIYHTCHASVLTFSIRYKCPAPGRSSLYDLDRGKSRTGLSLNSFYCNYDVPRSTLTYQPHYNKPQFVIDKRPELDTVRWRQDWLVGYKVTLLRGMSSECSFFAELQSDPHSPLSSILFLLPKDQTLKRVTKHPRSHLALLDTSHLKPTTKH